MTRITVTLHEDKHTFLSLSHLVLRMRNVAYKRKNQNAHFAFNNFFPPENPAVYEIMWKNIVEPGRPRMKVWLMRIACWIPEATNTHSEYVMSTAFPLRQWLHDRESMLRYT